MLNLADIYTDYLIAQNKHATATGLADLMPDELSHDQITRLLNKTPQTSKDLWLKIKADVREYEGLDDGVLALDDMIAEKPYSDENDIIAWHYDHSKGRTVKGINILTAMVRYGDVRLPIAYEVIEKTIRYSDLQTKKERRKSSFTKRKRRYLGRYFAHPMMQNRRAKRDDYKPSAVRVTQRCVP
nr:hypothetical protein [Piscirickettsia salmonis]